MAAWAFVESNATDAGRRHQDLTDRAGVFLATLLNGFGTKANTAARTKLGVVGIAGVTLGTDQAESSFVADDDGLAIITALRKVGVGDERTACAAALHVGFEGLEFAVLNGLATAALELLYDDVRDIVLSAAVRAGDEAQSFLPVLQRADPIRSL